MKRAAAVALLGATLTLAAFLFDTSPLFVPGVAFALVGIGTPVWIRLAGRGASAERRLDATRVLEDEPLEATVEVRRGRFGMPGAELVDPFADKPISVSAPFSLAWGARSATIRLVAKFPRRGLKQLEPPVIVVRDPLDLARARRGSTVAKQEVLVLPRTERVKWLGRNLGEAASVLGGRDPEPFAATEVDGLAPYRPGTPASRIHWPALARGAGLLERRMHADVDTRPLVVLDSRCSGPGEQLDAAVRAAASLALELAGRGGCGLLLPGERRPIELDPRLRSWPGAHMRLALVQGGPETRAPTPGATATVGPLIYVAAEGRERLPAVIASHRRCVLVLPSGLATARAGAAMLEVSGCSGVVMGAARRGAIRERAA